MCAGIWELPICVLGQRFSNIGRRIWLMYQWANPDKVHTDVPTPKSIGHGKVLPPNTWDRDTLLTYLSHMSEKVGQRLRQHAEGGHRDSKPILSLCLFVLTSLWKDEGIFQVQITVLDPKPRRQQIDLFEAHDEARWHSLTP